MLAKLQILSFIIPYYLYLGHHLRFPQPFLQVQSFFRFYHLAILLSTTQKNLLFKNCSFVFISLSIFKASYS